MEQLHTLDQTTSLIASLVANVRDDQLAGPTPCAGYDVRTLAGHLVGAAHLFADAAAGKPVELEAYESRALADEVDLRTAWDDAAAALTAAFSQPGAMERDVTLPFATMPGQMAMAVAQAELTIHGWDLARATGQSTDFPGEVVTPAMATAQIVITDEFRGPETFGPALDAPVGATAADQLAAYCGRQV
jgi:uncharacterized protein (TIGR03086 family)